MQNIYTAQEVADIIGVSYRRVLQLVKDGKLKSLDIGIVKITQEQLDAFLKGE